MYFSIGQASVALGVSVSTLRKWERSGRIVCSHRTIGGHRRFSIGALKEKFGLQPKKEGRISIAYARVSSHDQKEDLERQKQRLEAHCMGTGRPFLLIDDLGSGLNYKKRGLKKLIHQILSGNVEKIVLTHKDRLLRFGSEIIFHLCSFFDTTVELIEEEEAQSDEQRLTRDVIEIITVFSARLYGKRVHKKSIDVGQ